MNVDQYLINQYMDFLYLYLEVDEFAKRKGLTEDQAKQLIELGKSVYNSKNTES